MPSQTGTGFASGFVGAMAQALGAKQERGRKEDERARQNSLQLAQFLLQSGQVGSIDDLKPLLGHAMPEVFGETAKKPKAGQMDPAKTIGDVLNKSLQSSKGQPMLPGPAANQPSAPPQPAATGDTLQPGGALDTGAPTALPAPLPASPVTVPGAAPPQRTLAGVPLMSPEQAAQQKQRIATAGQAAEAEGNIALMQRFMPIVAKLRQTNPQGAQDLIDTAAVLGIRMPGATGVPSFSEIPGYVTGPDGKKTDVTGILDHRTGQIVDPITREPIKGFLRRATGGANDLGDLAERAAISLGYPSAQAAGAAGHMADVNQLVSKLAAETAGARTEASTTARTTVEANAPLSSKDSFVALRDLQGDWRKADAPQKETNRQLQVMETGLKRFKEGDKNGGSQAVLVTFQKILDPQSVVRESEYDRSPEGLGLKQRFQGFIDRLGSGGAGVPEPELEQMVETARQFVKGMGDYNSLERRRITLAARKANLDPTDVFGEETPPAGQKKDAGGAPSGQLPAPKGMEWVNGQLMIKK